MKIATIIVQDRSRREMGNIQALADSIQARGLLHPLVVRPDHVLVAGERRLAAVKLLGWADVPVTVVDNLEDAHRILLAEKEENECRENLRPSEQVALAQRLEPFEQEAAKERQREHGQTAPGRGKNTSGKLPPVNKTKSGDKVAAAVGTSRLFS